MAMSILPAAMATDVMTELSSQYATGWIWKAVTKLANVGCAGSSPRFRRNVSSLGVKAVVNIHSSGNSVTITARNSARWIAVCDSRDATHAGGRLLVVDIALESPELQPSGEGHDRDD